MSTRIIKAKTSRHSVIMAVVVIVLSVCASTSFAFIQSSADYILVADAMNGNMGQPASMGISTDNTYVNRAGIAYAETPQYNVTVTKSGTGTGIVTSPLVGIDCGSDCSETFISGSEITMTATEDLGSKFIGWTGCTSSSGSTCNVTVNSEKNIIAIFGQTYGSQYGLALTRIGSGTVMIKSTTEQIDCGTDCTVTGAAFNSGTKITLKAVPEAGYAFAGWTGNVCNGSKNTTCTVTMTADVNIAATFTLIPLDKYILTLSRYGNGTSVATTSNVNISCGSDCDKTETSLDAGTKVVLTAIADPGYAFALWYGDACDGSKNTTCTITINSDMSMVATFKALPVIKLTKSGGGTGTVSSAPAGISCAGDCSSQEYSPDLWQNIVLKATPDTGSKFIKWSGDICNGSKKTTCKINKMLNNKNVTATFGRADISVSAESITFEETAVKQLTTQALSVVNSGDASLVIKKFKITSTGGAKEAKMFKIYTDTIPQKAVSKATIQANSTLDLMIKFKPASAGQKTATMTITSDDPEEPLVEISLSGEGTINPLAGKKKISSAQIDYVTREEMAFIAVSQYPAINEEISDCDNGSPFDDVPADRWSCRYIKKLEELGLSGCDEARFCPEDYITREEMAEIIVMSLELGVRSRGSDNGIYDTFFNSELSTPDSQLFCDGSPFSDVPADSWSCKYIKRLYELGLTEEKDGQMFRPEDFVTKEQLETILKDQ